MTQVTITVQERQYGKPIRNAPVGIPGSPPLGRTGPDGKLVVDVAKGSTTFQSVLFKQSRQQQVTVEDDPLEVLLQHDFDLQILFLDPADPQRPVRFVRSGDVVGLDVAFDNNVPSATPKASFGWNVSAGRRLKADAPQRALWSTVGADGEQTVEMTVTDEDSNASYTVDSPFFVSETGGVVPVSLTRAKIPQTGDQALWVAIRNGTRAINFASYSAFVDSVLCNDDQYVPGHAGTAIPQNGRKKAVYGTGAYELLKTATQVFLLLECSPVILGTSPFSDEQLYDPVEEAGRLGRTLTLGQIRTELANYLGNNQLPYIDRVLATANIGQEPEDSVFCAGYLSRRAECPPMIELIWSYWHEEAMLEQTMNALSLRFQNIARGKRDPLAHLEISPLYPVNNLLWGFLENEDDRLSVPRRNYEYSHHYGLRLYGEAITDFRPADPRSQFIEAFHNLLYQTTLFYKQDDDTTFTADAFPILNALRETHLILAEGAHNQFGDLPWTARAEMLTEQWILSRPETRLFLQSRDMVPYREPWMPQVDTMKRLQGWTDVSVTHFNFLAVHGEQLLLSIRYGDWIDVTDTAQAGNWARYWRPEIQNYIHAYRAVTGVDLAVESGDARQTKLRATPPPVLLQQRSANGQVPGRSAVRPAAGFRERRSARAGHRRQNGQ